MSKPDDKVKPQVQDPYAENLLRRRLVFYQSMVSDLVRYAITEPNQLKTIMDEDKPEQVPVLFQLHQIARKLLETADAQPDDATVTRFTEEANQVLSKRGVGFAFTTDEFKQLSIVMRTPSFRPLAPYSPYTMKDRDAGNVAFW